MFGYNTNYHYWLLYIVNITLKSYSNSGPSKIKTCQGARSINRLFLGKIWTLDQDATSVSQRLVILKRHSTLPPLFHTVAFYICETQSSLLIGSFQIETHIKYSPTRTFTEVMKPSSHPNGSEQLWFQSIPWIAVVLFC